MNRSTHSLSGAVAVGLFIVSFAVIGAIVLGVTKAEPHEVSLCE